MEVTPDDAMLHKRNLFNLDYPQLFNCKLYSYNPSHSTMLMCLTSLEQHPDGYSSYTILFDSVEFFCGRMSWNGADFFFGKKHEYLRLVRNEAGDKAIDLSDVPSKLFCVSSSSGLVRIIASYAQIQPLAMWER